MSTHFEEQENKIMKKEIITTLITAIIGTIFGYSIHNEQNLTVQIQGQDVNISEVQQKIDSLENENKELKIQIENMSSGSQTGKDISASSKANNSDYLIYKLDPYSESGYRKVTNKSMNIAGVSYNNGFELNTTYSKSHCIFNLEGKYTSLSGKIGCDETNYTDEIPVEFWGDNTLIDTIVIYKDDLAQDFFVNLTGISKFEIKIPYASGSSVDFAEVKIF